MSSTSIAPGFGRAGLAGRITEDDGLWVLDFLFGPPAPVAAASGWRKWREYLTWCDGEPTTLRDGLRAVLDDAGVEWSTRRAVDDEVGTTWFPFFEQLYRQAITGGRDVLRVLADNDRIRILPFDAGVGEDRGGSIVVEGFPGWALTQCGLPATGYKHPHDAARRRGRAIVNYLRDSGIPISDADASRAVGDTEGEAVDALVLLLSAHRTSRRTASERRDVAGRHGRMEGWFLD